MSIHSYHRNVLGFLLLPLFGQISSSVIKINFAYSIVISTSDGPVAPPARIIMPISVSNAIYQTSLYIYQNTRCMNLNSSPKCQIIIQELDRPISIVITCDPRHLLLCSFLRIAFLDCSAAALASAISFSLFSSYAFARFICAAVRLCCPGLVSAESLRLRADFAIWEAAPLMSEMAPPTKPLLAGAAGDESADGG